MVGEGADVKVGKPLVSGGKVSGKVTAQGRGDKITIIKIPPPQALPAQAGSPAALHRSGNHRIAG